MVNSKKIKIIRNAKSRPLDLDWAEMVDQVNASSRVVVRVYTDLSQQLPNLPLSDKLAKQAAYVLENNNILFHRSANYQHYQEISTHIFQKLLQDSAIVLKNRTLFYRLCFIGVYTDYFKERLQANRWYERHLIAGIRYFVRIYQASQSSHDGVNYFLALIHLSQYYLFLGDLNKNQRYLERARKILAARNRSLHINYKLFFYYHYAWSFFERNEAHSALQAVNRLLQLCKGAKLSPIILHAMNIKCAILYSLNRYHSCYKLACQVSDSAKIIFSKSNLDVYAESLLNRAKCSIKIGFELRAAKSLAKKAIALLAQLFLGAQVDPSQALAHIVLGEVYERLQANTLALKAFNDARKIYEKIYRGKVKEQSGYQRLMDRITLLMKVK